MFRTFFNRLAPLRRHLSTASSSSSTSAPLPVSSLHTPTIPTSLPAPVSPGTFGSLSHVERRWRPDARGEPIKVANARRLGISVSPRKLNLVARLIRGLPVDEAHRQLAMCHKKTAPHVGATLTAAVKNAMAFAFRRDRLVVSEAWVGKGVYIRKIRPYHGKGRYGIEHKKYAHVTVVVRELDDELWEERCMPQYMYIPRGPPKSYNDHPIHRSDRCSWVSDLDKGVRASQQNIAALKQTIAAAKSAQQGSATEKQPA